MSDSIQKGQTRCSHYGPVIGTYYHKCCGGHITQYERTKCAIMGEVTLHDKCRKSCPHYDGGDETNIVVSPSDGSEQRGSIWDNLSVNSVKSQPKQNEKAAFGEIRQASSEKNDSISRPVAKIDWSHLNRN